MGSGDTNGTKPRIRIMTVDDHPIFRDGLAALIGIHDDFELVAEAGTGVEAVERYREHRPDVTLMDLGLPEMGGAKATQVIRSEFPDARIVVLTTFDGDGDIHRALEAGARGYLLKDSMRTEVADAIRAVHGGARVVPTDVAHKLVEYAPRVELTQRELEVLGLMARGLSNKQIADAIGRTEATVKVHVLHILSKLGVGDRTGAVTVALKRGLIHLT
jgi:DNA-binding NarL/FixJ family response regulator